MSCEHFLWKWRNNQEDCQADDHCQQIEHTLDDNRCEGFRKTDRFATSEHVGTQELSRPSGKHAVSKEPDSQRVVETPERNRPVLLPQEDPPAISASDETADHREHPGKQPEMVRLLERSPGRVPLNTLDEEKNQDNGERDSEAGDPDLSLRRHSSGGPPRRHPIAGCPPLLQTADNPHTPGRPILPASVLAYLHLHRPPLRIHHLLLAGHVGARADTPAHTEATRFPKQCLDNFRFRSNGGEHGNVPEP